MAAYLELSNTKKKRMDDDDDAAQYFCEQILTEIFLRLPVKSTFRFRCLSRTWNRRLLENRFRYEYKTMQRAKHLGKDSCSLLPLLGFFRGVNDSSIPKLDFAPSCIRSMPIRSRKFMEKMKDSVVLGCSNGVILCFSSLIPTRYMYYVCNPITDEWHQLPQPKNKLYSCTGFMYEEVPDKNGYMKPNYMVVRVFPGSYPARIDGLWIESYSSEYGIWRESILRGAEEFLLFSWRTFTCEVVNGMFYWIANRDRDLIQDFILVYDPKSSDNRIWMIEGFEHMNPNRSIFAESADGILNYALETRYGCGIGRLREPLRNYSTHTTVSSSEWIPLSYLQYCYPYYFMDPTIIAFHPENPRFILMRYGSTMSWYDLEFRSSKSIWCLPLAFLKEYKQLLVPYFQPEWPPSISFNPNTYLQ